MILQIRQRADSDRLLVADVLDSKRRPGQISVFANDQYPMRMPRLRPGDPIPPEQTGGMEGFVAGECGHRVAGSEWRAGYRNCERCGG